MLHLLTWGKSSGKSFHDRFIFRLFLRTLGKAWKHLKAKLQDEANAHQAFAVKVDFESL